MLLLLRGAAPANPSVTFSLQSGLAFDNSAHVTFANVLSFGPFDSVELQISVNFDLHTGLTPIPFLTVGPGVSFDTHLGLTGLGGYSDRVTFANTLNSGWTVGSTLQGAVSFAITSALTGDLRAAPVCALGLVSAISWGVPNISGGTLNAGVSFALQSALLGTPIFVDGVSFDAHTDLQATARIVIPNLATEVRLSFETDEMRLFFRKG